MTLAFAPSARSSVGIEWELMLADPRSGDLVGAGPEIVGALSAQTAHERYTVTEELLTNTVEVTSGVGTTVGEAIDDIAAGVAALRIETERRGLELLSAGSHPFAQWFTQTITDKTRYHALVERTQWWGRNMMIWGVHVHIGVDDVQKVMPMVRALSVYLPHLLALSASSPFWAGERTGYMSNRSLVFQQLPTAGLPWPLADWAAFESYVDDMVKAGVMADATEVRWDIRPAPRWGTIEVRVFDGVSTLSELAALAALTQVLVEGLARRMDRGEDVTTLSPWFLRENKWRAARYGLDAQVIVDAEGHQRRVSEHLRDLVDAYAPIAEDLGCAAELATVSDMAESGASATRQLAVAGSNDRGLSRVVQHLIEEFQAGPRRRPEATLPPDGSVPRGRE